MTLDELKQVAMECLVKVFSGKHREVPTHVLQAAVVIATHEPKPAALAQDFG